MKKININPEIAFLYGIMLGDGCISKLEPSYYFISICGHAKDDLVLINEVAQLLSEIRRKKVKAKLRNRKGAIEINFCDKKIFHLLHDLGIPIGKKGTSLCISKNFKEEYYKYIIQGYFATDGCLVITNNNGILYPRIEFSSISKNLLTQVLNYLKVKGMKGNLYISHKAKGTWNILYRIQFNGKANLYKFIEKIGFRNTKHIIKLNKYKSGGGDI